MKVPGYPGGWNKTHDAVERYKRLDSFHYGECVPLMKKAQRDNVDSTTSWKDGSEIGIVLYTDRLEVGYSIGADQEKVHDTLCFDGVPNNYGGADRLYFLCQFCGRRSRFL